MPAIRDVPQKSNSQRLTNTVHYIMRKNGHCIIDYIDDYVGVGVLNSASRLYHFLIDLMRKLVLTISDMKLVKPGTRVVCLGVLINSVQGTIAIPEDKLDQVNRTVQEWLGKNVCTKRQLQSILGLLLYVHKCVKPARVFLNRMLELLRTSHNTQRIVLTSDFKCDLRWFAKFLPLYNGVSLYDHKHIHQMLAGLGGRVDNCVYHLPLVKGYNGCTIVHLEMVNILLAIRLFASRWTQRKVRVI